MFLKRNFLIANDRAFPRGARRIVFRGYRNGEEYRIYAENSVWLGEAAFWPRKWPKVNQKTLPPQPRAASRSPKCISAVMQCALHYSYDLTSVYGIPRVRASRGKHAGNGARVFCVRRTSLINGINAARKLPLAECSFRAIARGDASSRVVDIANGPRDRVHRVRRGEGNA